MAGRTKRDPGARSRWPRELWSIAALLAVARTSFANHCTVPSGSMEHTLMPGDRVLVDMSA